MLGRSAILILLAAAATAGPQTPPKIQALIITGQNGHDWRATTPVLRKLLEETGRFEVRVTEEFRGAGAETLAPYDVVILNYYDSNRPELRWGERTETALLDFVKSGKGVVVYHFSSAAFSGWLGYEQLCGGNWRPGHGHHSARHDFTVDIRDKEHAITRGMKGSFVEGNDELYANLQWQPEGSYHVLATAWDEHARYKAGEKQPLPGAGLDQPMLWTVDYGKGRVFATALGHDADAMNSMGFAATLVRGTEWAATGAVSIPLPAELR